ncbi:MAG: MTH938/NDUFAF3 family protein [Rhodothermaceae bacterium]
MKPKVSSTQFGTIIINDQCYDYDIYIDASGKINKRMKKLSKKIHGTTHILSLPEAELIYEEGVEKIIIGSGYEGILTLSDDAKRFFEMHNCKVEINPTPVAVDNWNKEIKKSVGLFQITC